MAELLSHDVDTEGKSGLRHFHENKWYLRPAFKIVVIGNGKESI